MRCLYFLLFLIAFSFNKVNAQVELLVNKDFSNTNSGWFTTGYFQYDSRFNNFNFGAGYAFFSDFNGQPRDNISGTIFQNFTIPANTNLLNISFYYNITTSETTTSIEYDYCNISLIDLNTSNKVLIKRLSNLQKSNSYIQVPVSLTGTFTNSNYRIELEARNDNGKPTVFRFDDFSVLAYQNTTSCINWTNGIKPTGNLLNAMDKLCSYGIISNNQDASTLTSLIRRIDVATCLGKALFGITPPSFLDNFPTIYPEVNQMPINEKRYFLLMLYLEYKNKLSINFGTDDISPFSREYLFPTIYTSINKSDAIKAMLEAWDLEPSMVGFDPASSGFSQFLCDIKVNNKNLGWLQRAYVLGMLNDITTPCSNGHKNFGNDGQLQFGEFYLMLAKMLDNPAPNISYNDFYIPNLFNLENLNSNVGTEKGVFHEYTDNGFNIPSGAFSLDFEHSYHSNLTEIPVLNSNSEQENSFLKPKLQPLGGGWTHSYNIFIKSLDNNGNKPERILIYWEDGTIHSYLVLQNRYEAKNITDKLTIDSFNNVNQPSKITIKKGRLTFTFRLIDPIGYATLSLVEIRDSYNNTLNFDYIDGVASFSSFRPKLLSKVTESLSNRSLIFKYNNLNYLESVTDPISRVLKFYVNPFYHDLDSSSDAKNFTTKYTYSKYVGTYAYPSHLLTQIQKPKGNIINNTYSHRKLKQTQTPTYTIKVAAVPNYQNAWTQQTSQVTVNQNNQTLTNNYTFDPQGNIIDNSNETESIKREFDANNRLILERDIKLGFISRYAYDANGYLSRKSIVDVMYNDSLVYEYTNNNFGEVTKIKDWTIDPPYNFVQTNIYRNPQGSPTDVVTDEATGIEMRHRYAYNSNGTLNNYISPTNFYTYFKYNNFGNVTEVEKNNVNFSKKLIEKFEYDQVSRVIKNTNPKNIPTTYNYDPNDNLLNVTEDPSGLNLSTNYTYNPNDLLASTKSPKGHTTSLDYNYYTDDLIEENDGTNKKSWRFNEDGSLDSFINKKNDVFKYTYYNDAIFPGTKFKGMLFSDGLKTYSYHDNSNTLKRLTYNGKENRLWFANNLRGKFNRAEYTNTGNFFTGSTPDHIYQDYDLLGRIKNIAYPSFGGKSYGYQYYYDRETKNIAAIYDRNNPIIKLVDYTYTKDGKPKKTIYQNGDTIFYYYDNFDRQDSIRAVNKNNQVLYTIRATYDDNGNRLSENTSIYYQGNIVSTIPNLVNDSTNYTYKLNNQILTGNNSNFNTNAAGELTNTSSTNTSFSWDAYGQLTQANRNGVATNYEYDALGIRRRNGNTYYVVDQSNTGNVIIEATQNTTPINVYVYGNGLLARIDPITDSMFYYHYDFRGSVIAITNAEGQMVQYYQYLPYGGVYNKAGRINWQNPFQYVGKYGVMADDSDLYFMKARYYQPSTGRFLSEDPVWNTNLFFYADDDPINKIDPNGEFALTDPVGQAESWIPIWGNLRHASYEFAQGNIGMGVLHSVFLVADVFGGEGLVMRKALNVALKSELKRSIASPLFRGALNPKNASHFGTAVHMSFRENTASKFLKFADKTGIISIDKASKGPDIIRNGFGVKSWWDITTAKEWAKGFKQIKYRKFGVGKGLIYKR